MDKVEWYKGYRFAIAFENTRVPGYVSEKIMHAFAAGAVPIYWGAPDVTRYFNPRAFINAADFSSHEELAAYVQKVD